MGICRNHILIHELRYGRRAVGKHQGTEGYFAEQLAFFNYIADINGFFIHSPSAYRIERLPCRQIWRKVNKIRRHEGAGTVLRVIQKFIDLFTGLRVRLTKNTLYNIRGHFLDDVGRIVKIQLADEIGKLAVGKSIDKELL